VAPPLVQKDWNRATEKPFEQQANQNLEEERNFNHRILFIHHPIKTHVMSYQLKTKSGATEAVIDDNCGISKFYAIAHTLSEDLQVIFINQVDESETLNWDFKYKDQFLTLHYNIFEGVSIYPQHIKTAKKENIAVMEVAHFLERHAF
jgi:hypothetical protein